MLADAASYYQEGDSGPFSAAMTGIPLVPARGRPYFKMTSPTDPLAFPIHSAQIMAKFPSSLLVATTRDIGLSPVVYTHSRLLKLGVEAELHVWEGLAHEAYAVMPDLPQSREVRSLSNFSIGI